MSVTGIPGSPPAKSGIPICDLSAGLSSPTRSSAPTSNGPVSGSANVWRPRFRKLASPLSVWEATEYFTTRKTQQPTGSAHRTSAPYQASRCSDGYIAIGGANQRSWERLCQALGPEGLLSRREFATDGERVRHRDELAELIEAVTLKHPRAHWSRVLEEAGVPCGSINTYPEGFTHPQVLAREMLQHINHPVGGRIPQLGPAVKCSESLAKIRRPAPRLAEHTAEVLQELDYGSEQIASLAKKGVITLCPSLST